MMTAVDILNLLAIKHAEDVFVPECKDGPTHHTTHKRVDAWVMKKSWVHPLVIVYEIKTHRSDFLKDDKWRVYLELGNELYFVAPKGTITANELPAEIGLLEASPRRLITRKKAIYRDVTIPLSVYQYILMCRTRVVKEQYGMSEMTADEKLGGWRDWLDDKERFRNLDLNIKGKIREEILKAQDENKVISRRLEVYDDIRNMLKSLGLSPEDASRWDVRDVLEQRDKIIFIGRINSLIDGAKHIRDQLEAQRELL